MFLYKQGREKQGEEMIFDLAEHLKENLQLHNEKPLSFHEEVI